MPSSRPSQVRSVQRRHALLQAAIELLAEGGAKTVTHRAVAARAGVPAATTTYYFDSIQSLTEEALRCHVEERVQELEALRAELMTEGATLEQMAWRFAQVLAGRSKLAAIAQYEVYLEGARNAALHRSAVDALGAFERLAEDTLRALGARQPAEAARSLVALVDGFMLHRLVRGDEGGQGGGEGGAGGGEGGESGAGEGGEGGDGAAERLFAGMEALLVTQLVDADAVEPLFRRYQEIRAGPPASGGGPAMPGASE